LQKINHNVFKDVDLMMNNMVLVTNHIKTKIKKSSHPFGQQETLNIIPTLEGKYYHKDDQGFYWRTFEFLKGLKSYDFVETTDQAYEGAKAFGQFLVFLDDFPVQKLGESIPGFHDIILRLKTFQETLGNSYKSREQLCKSEINYVMSLGDRMSQIEKLRIKGIIKERVTHNDTKFNNVLLTKDDVGKCVIDLDTVMPGVVHYDFGDGVRTSAGTSLEDETDFRKIDLDMGKFEAFSEGYLDATRSVLDPVEVDSLALSGPLFSYIMGVRFLTDFLSGDNYYKIEFEDQNLQRARCQLEFTRKMLLRLEDMQSFITNKFSVR
jgi:hypothetical protein